MRYAVIEQDKVINIIEAEARGAESLAAYMTLVATGERPVAIGDSYEDGRFYREGEEIVSPLEELTRYYEAMQEVIEA